MRVAIILSVVTCSACTYDIPDLVQDHGSITSDDGGGTPEAGGGADATCADLLCACASASDCSSKICADSLIIGSALIQAAGSKFCMTPCCTSNDCPTTTVCFGSGNGGNYCVNPTWLGRVSPGSSAAGGSPCTAGQQCRSGLCSNGTCADTCCSLTSSGTECTGARACAFGTFPGAAGLDTHYVAFCQPYPGSGTFGSLCSVGTECQGGLCIITQPSFCTVPCRSSDECGSGSACQYTSVGTDLDFACLYTFASQTLPLGASCSDYNQCIGGICNSNECTNVCFTDADCRPALPHCTPQQTLYYDTFPTQFVAMCTQ
jgi:hypothetical protein